MVLFLLSEYKIVKIVKIYVKYFVVVKHEDVR